MNSPPADEAALRAAARPRFARVLARDRIYLANHSLGRPPDRMTEDVAAALEAWLRHLGGAWTLWLEHRERFRALVAGLVGAPRPDCIVPKTSAAQGLRAVLGTLNGPARVLSTEGEFDSLDFVLRAWRSRGRIALELVPPRDDGTFHVDDLIARLAPHCQLVVLSSVMFRTGQVIDGLPRLVAAARTLGARVLLDTYHHAGALPLDLGSLGCDYAVGGSYKYLRGGPGACWLYVSPALLDAGVTPLDTGWFAKEAPFSYLRPEPPRWARGGDGWLESTPPVLAVAQALAGLEFTAGIGVERLRTVSLAQLGRLKAFFAARGIAAQGGDEAHGGFLTLRHARAGALVERLAAVGVDIDARGDTARFCPCLLTGDDELEAAATHTATVLSEL